MKWDEKKDLMKRQKINDLWLADGEWERLGLFNSLLAMSHPFMTLGLFILTCSSMPITHNMHFYWNKQ
jgi:hypothetical protein